jgi:hypothetical protein
MQRPLAGVRLSKVNTALLMAGVALLIVAVLGRWVTVASNQILPGAPWWVQVVLGMAGLLAIAWAVATSREPGRELRTGRGFLGAPPGMPDRLVERPDLSEAAVAALRAGGAGGADRDGRSREIDAGGGSVRGSAGATAVPGRGDLAGSRSGARPGNAAGCTGPSPGAA